jgi:hypothetical protein
MPVFGPGGGVVAALELSVPDLRQDLNPIIAALAIASRSLSREIGDRDRRFSAIPAVEIS